MKRKTLVGLTAIILSLGIVTGVNALGESAPRIEEDDPRWDCRVMGNLTCGVEVHGDTYLIEFEDGEPVAVQGVGR